VHCDLKRTIGGYSADGHRRHFHHSRESLEAVDANRAACVAFGVRAEYGSDPDVISSLRVGQFRIAAE